MAKQLDFIIFGVPRSGTKALVRALNLHPHVYCAMERFHFRTDHSRLTFPDSFLDTSAIRDADDLAKIEDMHEELAAKDEVLHAGNKLPRYYFALDRLNREVPGLKNIWIYRSPYGFMPSWNRRELDRERGQWPAGQVGLFGLIELLVCIENCLKLDKDVFVFSYARGFARSAEATLETLDFLGADPSLHDQKAFDKKQRLRGRRQQAPQRDGRAQPSLAGARGGAARYAADARARPDHGAGPRRARLRACGAAQGFSRPQRRGAAGRIGSRLRGMRQPLRTLVRPRLCPAQPRPSLPP